MPYLLLVAVTATGMGDHRQQNSCSSNRKSQKEELTVQVNTDGRFISFIIIQETSSISNVNGMYEV